MLALLRTLPVVTIVLGATMPIAALPAQGNTAAPTNIAKVTLESGPDRGTYTMEVGRSDQDGAGTCIVRPRADREAGWAFTARFYPQMAKATGGPMEATTTFNVGPSGTTTEVSLAISFLVGKQPNLDLRAYEVETRPFQETSGRGSATFARRGTTATARVEAETATGVNLTMEIDCKAVSER